MIVRWLSIRFLILMTALLSLSATDAFGNDNEPAVSSGLVLPTVFSDHMVLQRERPVQVWGRAMPGTTVTVEFAGQTKSGVAGGSGRWQVTLDPMSASFESREMVIQSQDSGFKFQISDILVGEVWLCSGQSNMEMALQGFGDCPVDNSAAEIDAADYPAIRLYNTPQSISASPTERIDACWAVCTPETAKSFSACAYFFGRKLHQDLGVPVGLLLSAWGGSRIEPWVPACGFEGIDSLADIRQQIRNMPSGLGTNPKRVKRERQTPTVIYNGMLAANVPFAIRGAIWYQGEANRPDGMLYVDKTKALLNGWRKLWGYDFPFYFVQIAPYRYGSEDPSVLPEFWGAESEIVKSIPNTGMAVINDAATLNCIHPPDKKTPGTRLALLAEAKTYGMNVICSGPTFDKMKTKGSRIVVTFTSADGLTTRDGKEPDWFEMAGEDGDFKPAHAEINKDRIILSSPDVTEPKTMRFAWDKQAMPNLMNGAGLPASAFRAGMPARIEME